MEERRALYEDAGSGGLEMAEVPATSTASSSRLAGGHLLTAISTSIVGILREHYGRGPMKAKTYVLDDIIVVVMRGRLHAA